MNTRTLLAILCLSIFIIVGLWIAPKISVTYEDARHPPSSSIIKNPLSALEHLLISQGIEAQSLNNRKRLHSLPSTSDALFIRNIKQPLTKEREDALISWIEQGGLVVYEPYWLGRSDVRPYFHQRFGIEIQALDEYEEYGNPLHAQADINGHTAYIHVTPQYYLMANEENNHTVVLESEIGAHGFHVKLGKGNIIFLSDTQFLSTPRSWLNTYETIDKPSNYGLSGHDHAYFIYFILKNRKKVWLIHDTTSPSLLSETYSTFPLLSTFSLIWLILFFIYLLKHIGPITTNEPGATRDLLQHIQQSGLYYWKLDKGASVINQWRIKILKRLTIKYPHLSELKDENLSSAIEEITQISLKEIQSALYQTPKSSKEFTHIIRTLKQLWTM